MLRNPPETCLRAALITAARSSILGNNPYIETLILILLLLNLLYACCHPNVLMVLRKFWHV
jgi:hypothetical protein